MEEKYSYVHSEVVAGCTVAAAGLGKSHNGSGLREQGMCDVQYRWIIENL
jgi:hypothetical protein